VLGLGPRLALDAAGRERLVDLFSAVDVLVTPQESAESLLARSGESRELGHAIAAEWDFDTVVVSRGRQGAVAVEGSTIHERDGVESDDVDPTGQHAALAGAFLGRRLAGDDVATALTRGVAAGALMRTIPGPTPTIDPAAVETIVADFERGQGF
jgi:2-dehydro-3-deoxygluconokinase